jgi:hypothetical protein
MTFGHIKGWGRVPGPVPALLRWTVLAEHFTHKIILRPEQMARYSREALWLRGRRAGSWSRRKEGRFGP